MATTSEMAEIDHSTFESASIMEITPTPDVTSPQSSDEENEILFSYFNIGISRAALKSLEKGNTVKKEVMDSFVRKLNSTRSQNEQDKNKVCNSNLWTSIVEQKPISEIIKSNNLQNWRNYPDGRLIFPAYFSSLTIPTWGLVRIFRISNNPYISSNNNNESLRIFYYTPDVSDKEINFKLNYEDLLSNLFAGLLEMDENYLRMSCDPSWITLDEIINPSDYVSVIMVLLKIVARNASAKIRLADGEILREEFKNELINVWKAVDFDYLYENDKDFHLTGKDLNSLKRNEVFFSYFGVDITSTSLNSLNKGQDLHVDIMNGFIRKLNFTYRSKNEDDGIFVFEAKVWDSISENKLLSKVDLGLSESNIEKFITSRKGKLIFPAYFENENVWGVITAFDFCKNSSSIETLYYFHGVGSEKINVEKTYGESFNNFLSELLGQKLKLFSGQCNLTQDENIKPEDIGMLIMVLLRKILSRSSNKVNKSEEVEKFREELKLELNKLIY